MKNNIKTIYLRDEMNPNELRTPLTPEDIKSLIHYGFQVFVKSSKHRIYSDNEYVNAGAELTDLPWHSDFFDKNETLIVGLKDIEHEYLDNHNHLYFSHTYKNQKNSKHILRKFLDSKSILYDYEYFVFPDTLRRIISFGYYAGIVGCALGLLQYATKKTTKKDIEHCSYWEKEESMFQEISQYTKIFSHLHIGLIGGHGNCGSGVRYVLDKYSIHYDIIERNTDPTEFTKYDIFYNCILLNEQDQTVFFDGNSQFTKQMCIVDISCDNKMDNNPIRLYNENGTWQNPVCNVPYREIPVDIISINNLPSLLPKDSSKYFSSRCVELIKQINDDPYNYWDSLTQMYYQKIFSSQAPSP